MISFLFSLLLTLSGPAALTTGPTFSAPAPAAAPSLSLPTTNRAVRTTGVNN